MNDEQVSTNLSEVPENISVSNNDWTDLLSEIRDNQVEIYQVIEESKNVEFDQSVMNHYQNVEAYFSFMVILNCLLLGALLCLIFSNFFAGGNHR